MIPAVFAEDICTQAKNATCDNVAEVNGDKVKKECQKSVFQIYSQTLINCQNEVEKEKRELESQIEDIERKERSAEWYSSKLNLDIRYLNYEIANLNLSLSELESEIEKREKAIKELNDALAHQKDILSEALRQVYEYDITSYVEVLLGYGSLSEFGNKLTEMDKIQIELRAAMNEIQKAKEKMEKEKTAMEKDKKEKVEYKKVQEYSIYSLAVRQDQQEYLLRQLAAAKTPLEREMARIQAELIGLRDAMSRIRQYLSQWVLSGQVTPEAIFAAVQNAAGIISGRPRAALLLGILEIESDLGQNVGKIRDLENAFSWSPTQLSVYLDICKKLCNAYGNPYCKPETLPLSRDGAMGPAQFIPTSWRAFEKYVISKFPGEVPNPWNLNHALVAMAAYVGRYSNEWTGVNCYGPGGCGGPDWYADTVIRHAKTWQNIINVCGFDLQCSQMKNKLEELGF